MRKRVRHLFSLMALVSVLASVAYAADIVVVDDANTRAFFGFHGSSMFADQPEQLWDETVDWAVGGAGPDNVVVLLFTFDGTLSDTKAANTDAIGFYNLLTGQGYTVQIDNQLDFATRTDYGGFDLAVFPNFGYSDATAPPADNVIAAALPFITMEPAQTDELNIGTGVTVFSGTLSEAVVVDNDHVITDYDALNHEIYELGEIITMANIGGGPDPHNVPTDGITTSGNGRVLIGQVPEPATMVLLATGLLFGAARLRRRKQGG